MAHRQEYHPSEEVQPRFNFDVVKNALCFDNRLPYGHEMVRRDLTHIGEDGKYVDQDGWIYERSIHREIDGPEPRYVRTDNRYQDPRIN